MWSSWPECPPYGGVYDEQVPHLTITETAPPEQIAAARRALRRRGVAGRVVVGPGVRPGPPQDVTGRLTELAGAVLILVLVCR
jgi:hypothetical protein